MLRRTRLALPLIAALGAAAGALTDAPWPVVVAAMFLAGIGVDLMLVRTEEGQIDEVADQLVAIASAEAEQPDITGRGGREWQRLTAALNQVGAVLRSRFEELRDERARGQRLLDAMPTSVLLFTDDGLVYANPEAREQFELTDEAGLSPLRALGVMALQQAVEEAQETGRDVTVPARRAERELMARAIRVADHETALIVTDLTNLTRVEAMRRDFVANASHELKTPVTGMQALADSLQMAMDRDPDRARTMVGRIQTEATRLAHLVRELLDLTRLEEGADERTRGLVDLRGLVRTQVERMRVLAETKEVELHVEADHEANVVGVNEDLKLMVGNLLQNAIQYNQPGGHVTVRVGRKGAHAYVEVADSGLGIPEADQVRIFERFYRVDKARSRAAGGTGLGLSLVRNAAERHGGTVRVASVLGEGSTFTIDLPVDGGVA